MLKRIHKLKPHYFPLTFFVFSKSLVIAANVENECVTASSSDAEVLRGVRNEYGFVVAHVLASKRRFGDLRSLLKQVLEQEGTPFMLLFRKILYTSSDILSPICYIRVQSFGPKYKNVSHILSSFDAFFLICP